MPLRRKKQKAPFTAADVAALAKSNPYVQRLVVDAKLRENVRTAADSVRKVYDRVSDGKVTAKGLLEDKKSQSDLRKALENLRDATLALTEPPKKKRRFGRLLVLTGVGTGAALAASEKLRSKVLDLLFGAEEEFQYTPPPSTAPPTPPPPAGATAGSPADTAAGTGTQAGS